MKCYTVNLLTTSLLMLFLLIPYGASSNTTHNFLVLTDIHLDQSSQHVMEISPSINTSSNDMDYQTFINLISNLDQQIQNGTIKRPEFILVLGDLVAHLCSSTGSAADNETTVFKTLQETFSSIPIFYVFGNNDSLQTKYGPFAARNYRKTIKSPYDIAQHTGGWTNGFLSTGVFCDKHEKQYPCILTENNFDGYYSAYLDTKLRMIALNSVLFSTKRSHVTAEDASEQLTWFAQQLETAKANGESVLIAMHVPPGRFVFNHLESWMAEDERAFLKIIDAYQDNIIGLLAAHTHTEELKIIKDPNQKIIAGVYLTAALSTAHGNEPSVKTFFLSHTNQNWLLSNYETFHFSREEDRMLFDKLYDYNEYYCDDPNKTLLQCLDRVTPLKMDHFFTAGNKHFGGGLVRSMDDFTIYP